MKTFLRIILGVALAALAILVWQDSQAPLASADTRASELVGQPALPFTLRTVDGTGEVTLADLEGQVVVLDFWALYCRPCIEAMPHLQALHERYASEGVTVIGINVDQPAQDRVPRIQAFVREQGLTFDVLLDRGTVGWAYGARRIPYVVVIDRSGIVQHVVRGGSRAGAVELALEDTLSGAS